MIHRKEAMQSVRQQRNQNMFCLALAFLSLQWPCANCARSIGIQVRLTGTDGNRLGIDRHQVAAAALMAARHVNDRVSSIVPLEVVSMLPEAFYLNWEMRDTYSSPQVGVRDAVDWTGLEGNENEAVDMIIGAIRSAVSGPVALVAQVTETPLMSYWSTSAALSDKSIYPNFLRTVPPDSLNAFAMTNILAEMGWTTFSVLFLNDLYGVGYAQDLASAAGTLGLTVATSQKYTSGEPETIRQALVNIKQTNVRIVVCIVFSTDMVTLLEYSEELGTNGRGWIWITGDAISDPGFVLDSSPNRNQTAEHLHGWLQVQPAAFAGNNGPRFQEAWFNEPASLFNHSLLSSFSQHAELQNEACPEICGFAYDAVWAAAIAISKAQTTDQGKIDKSDLLAQLFSLDFEASTGTVSFDENGDRAKDSIAVAMFNWQVTGSTLQVKELGLWYGGVGLLRNTDVEPVWGEAGLVGWDDILADGSSCASGSVYSDETLQCVECLPGTAQRGGECIPCDLGTQAPFVGMIQCVPCDHGTFANETGLAACLRCPTNSEVPFGSSQTSRDECECLPGFLFGCQWHVWQLLVLCLGFVLLCLAGCVAVLYFRREQGTEEERRVAAKMKELRARLYLQQSDGVLLTGEARSWLYAWRSTHQSQHRLNPKCLESAARLALFLEFDTEAFDMLYIYATLLDSEKAEFGRSSSSTLQRKVQSLKRALTIKDVVLEHVATEPRRTSAELTNQRLHSNALSLLLLDVSKLLLDPSEGDRLDDEVSLSGVSGLSYIAEATPGDRFDYFVSRLAKLRLWQDFNNFNKLKEITQHYMNDLRRLCDQQFEAMKQEEGGEELIRFATPSDRKTNVTFGRTHSHRVSGYQVHISPAALQSDVELPITSDHEINGRLEFSKITRQDSAMVQAVRLDEQDWKEIEVQWESNFHNGSSSGRSGSASASRSASRNASGRSTPGEIVVDNGSPLVALTPESEGTIPLRRRRRLSIGSQLPSLRSNGEGSESQFERLSSEGGSLLLSRNRGADAQELGSALDMLQQMTSFTTKTPSRKKSKRDKLLDERMLDNALRSVVVRQKMIPSARTLAVDEEVYIGHLHQRATLLNDGFQKQIRVVVGQRLLELQNMGASNGDGQTPLVQLVVSDSKRLKPASAQHPGTPHSLSSWLKDMITGSAAGGVDGRVASSRGKDGAVDGPTKDASDTEDGLAVDASLGFAMGGRRTSSKGSRRGTRVGSPDDSRRNSSRFGLPYRGGSVVKRESAMETGSCTVEEEAVSIHMASPDVVEEDTAASNRPDATTSELSKQGSNRQKPTSPGGSFSLRGSNGSNLENRGSGSFKRPAYRRTKSFDGPEPSFKLSALPPPGRAESTPRRPSDTHLAPLNGIRFLGEEGPSSPRLEPGSPDPMAQSRGSSLRRRAGGSSPRRARLPTGNVPPLGAKQGDSIQSEVAEKAILAELALSASDDVQVHGAPIKTKARMREKVKSFLEEEGLEDEEVPLPLTACILDPVRASVVCNGPRSILEHAAWFMEHGNAHGLPTVRVKNKFAIQNSKVYDGYRDLMISVMYTGEKGLKIIGEVQLHDHRMYALKVKMHKLYKVKRATSADQIQ